MKEAASQRILSADRASSPEAVDKPAVLPLVADIQLTVPSTDAPNADTTDDNVQPHSVVDDPPSAATSWRGLILNRGDQLFVALVVSVMLALMAVHWLRLSGWGLKPVEIERLEPLEFTFRVDVNKATWVEWAQLEGVGQILARRIVADREERGPFASIDDVQRVKGIGPKKLEQLRPWLTLDEAKPSR